MGVVGVPGIEEADPPRLIFLFKRNRMDRWCGSDFPDPERRTEVGLAGVEFELKEFVELTDIIEEIEEIERRWFGGRGVVKCDVSDW